MSKTKQSLNERIAIYRQLAGYTQQEVAQKLGMSKSTYSQKERSSKIDCQLLIKLSKLFRVDVRDLLLGSDDGQDGIILEDSDEKTRLFLTSRDERLIRMIHSLSPQKQLMIKLYVYRLYTEQNQKQ